jgi:hypothetical protein|tara:strand:- start:21 stop:254 length:234 start_codon:yes stop_codon:yes gene_type:complete
MYVDEFVPVPEMYYDEETEICFEAVIPKDVYNLLNNEMDETGNDRNEVMTEILYDGLIMRMKERGEEVEESNTPSIT